ncbi:Cyclic AMP-responsive element-binding protein-like protein [Emericellopsis cladophorae]|uniref:Cyclic AMP-responsive element-binding protein-like protein n=1 Tax=Emericellopsis cladophorae TaxID=2686198 RepID=A0A9P9XYQ5_9HYPO|nr:Cyclic AMP-responsive element-binding protein-like protein [Emericellopsis cladophorae]KAI6780076.1 Cyclic AMP-responsive element-binding protein-like protein [Emericellopsis cladophorae]
MSTLTQNLVNMDDFMNFNTDSDASIVDPQLTMQYPGHLHEKVPESMNVDPSAWQDVMDPRFTSLGDSQDFQLSLGPGESGDVAEASMGSPPEDGALAGKDIHTSNDRAGRKSSNESVPSLSWGSSDSPPATTTTGTTRQTRRKTTKTTKARESESRITKGPAAKRQKTKRQPEAAVSVVMSEDDGDPKRSKYLERNRIAASKCRQKKKAWVSDLETQKSELENTNRSLQRECTELVEQVTQLKNELMGHAGCADSNIDGWLETEAKRFVQRTTNDAEHQRERRFSSCGSGSGAELSLNESLLQHSPGMSASFAVSPVVKHEEINYDHMPDNMFA